MRLNIFGKYVPVVYKDLTGEDSDKMAYYDSEDQVIYVDSPNKDDLNLLCHEIVHAMRDRLHIQMDDGLEEQLAQNVADVITDNFNLSLKHE